MNNNLSERFLDFGVYAIKRVQSLGKSFTEVHIGGQLIRSATSAGANYEEGCAAESRPDFIHKLQISLKELRETLYWIKLLKRTISVDEKSFDILFKESDELCRIIAKSITTAKQ